MNFGISNVPFLKKKTLSLFGTGYDKMCPSFFSDFQFITHWCVSFQSKFGQKDRSFIQVTKSILYIPDIRMDILMYEKGGVIKHLPTPAIVKVELIDLGKI